MFYKYEINNMNGEDVLYLYLSLKYEFANEFIEDKNLRILSKNFIKANNINFKGKRIFLVVDGIIVKSISIDHDKYVINTNFSPDKYLVNLSYDDNSLSEISLREYLLSILFLFYSNEFGDEIYKAICVLYNTYAYKMMGKDGYISTNNEYHIYKHFNEYQGIYKNYNSIIKRFNTIIDSVACRYLTYKNDYILPFIHYSNCGFTSTNSNYPYLSKVKSLWDLAAPGYINIYDYTFEQVSKILSSNVNSNTKIHITNNGQSIKIGDRSSSIPEVRSLFNLKSTNICIIVNKSGIRFITKGHGNGLGMSIYGAQTIEQNGGKYYNILNHYFPKTKLCVYIKELSN